jgi:hypothetical protein
MLKGEVDPGGCVNIIRNITRQNMSEDGYLYTSRHQHLGLTIIGMFVQPIRWRLNALNIPTLSEPAPMKTMFVVHCCTLLGTLFVVHCCTLLGTLS